MRETARRRGYTALAEEKKKEAARAERERLERVSFVARVGAKTCLTGKTLGEVGDFLEEKGFDMAQARSGGGGKLIVPHKTRKTPATIRVVL